MNFAEDMIRYLTGSQIAGRLVRDDVPVTAPVSADGWVSDRAVFRFGPYPEPVTATGVLFANANGATETRLFGSPLQLPAGTPYDYELTLTVTGAD